MAQVKLVAESFESYVEGNSLQEALMDNDINEGSKERFQVASALAKKEKIEPSDLEKYGKIIDSILDKFKPAQAGKKGDPELKIKEKIKENKGKYLDLVTKMIKVYKQARDTKQSAFMSWDANLKKLNVRAGNPKKADVGNELGQ